MQYKKEVIPAQLRKKVFERDGYTCRYCSSTKPPFHCDHVYPESKGGKTVFENLVTACQECNQKKHAKIGVWPLPLETAKELAKTEKRYIKEPRKAELLSRELSGQIEKLSQTIHGQQEKLERIRAWYATDKDDPPKVSWIIAFLGFIPIVTLFFVIRLPLSNETQLILWVAVLSPIILIMIPSFVIFRVWQIRHMWRSINRNGSKQ